ncbi:MAG TPA: protein kinase, partial [Propionibacteriaceae bacterium]|nr:protein kinase [Propionibacteriaceae bacterium]
MERTDTGRSDDPLIGRILDGRYRVGPRIARGGMATVYQATDLRLDRTVAVKIMHAGLGDDPEFVARFEREARSAARLSHHNVVAVFDQGDDAGTLFLVMEYVPGLTLRDVIRKEAPMEPGKALGLLEPMLAALAAAHGAGMIHRDVKPENVLLATDSDSGAARVKVADFGLARAINAETQHTATGGVLIGTVSYLSPELVVDGKADARSDVYAAGVMLYEMLTGQKPHQADSPIQVAYKHVHEDIPAPSLRAPGLPAYVDALVARATARDKDLRPTDARVLLHQVRRVRQALDHGVRDDPELTADLRPGPSKGAAVRELEDTGTDELFIPRDTRSAARRPVPARPVVVPAGGGGFDPDFEVTTPVSRAPVVPASRTAATPPRPPVTPPPVVP